MSTVLTINQEDFSKWIKPGGLSVDIVYRCRHSVVTMDGTEYRSHAAEKYALGVQLVTMADSLRVTLLAALNSPAAVSFTDRAGVEQFGTFHINDIHTKGKIIRNGITYWEEVSFTMDER